MKNYLFGLFSIFVLPLFGYLYQIKPNETISIERFEKRDNPYAHSLNTWLAEKHEDNIDNSEQDGAYARIIGGNILNRSWGLTHPLAEISDEMREYHKLRLKKEVDYLIQLSKKYNGRFTSGQNQNNIERFVLRNVLDALYRLNEKNIYPENIDHWLDAFHLPVQYQYIHYWHGPRQYQLSFGNNRRAGYYPNADAMYVLIMGLAARLYDDENYAIRAHEFTRHLEKRLLPGGGFNYIHRTCDIPSYHSLVVTCLARYHEISEDSLALHLVKESRDYYPLTLAPSGITEKTPHPYWKRQMGMTTGPGSMEIVASISGEGRNKYLAQQKYPPGISVIAVDYWTDNVKPVEPATDIAFEDPNINGFRGRFGDFTWLGMLGHGNAVDAFGGAMFSEFYDGKSQLHGMLELITPEIGISENHSDNIRYAYTTGSTYNGDYCLTDGFGALAVNYQPYYPWKSQFDLNQDAIQPLPWKITQFWLMLPDRVLASITMECKAHQTIKRARTRIRVHPYKSLKQLDGNTFSARKLRLKLLNNDFSSINTGRTEQHGNTFSPERMGDEIFLTSDKTVFNLNDKLNMQIAVFPEGKDVHYQLEEKTIDEMPALKIDGDKSSFLLVFNPTGTPKLLKSIKKGTWSLVDIKQNVENITRMNGAKQEVPAETLIVFRAKVQNNE